MKFAIVPMEAVKDKRLNARDFRVLMALLHRALGLGECFPSREDLADLTGLPATRISEVTTRLEALGWVSKKGRGGKKTVYVVHLPEEAGTVTETVTVTDSVTVTKTVTPTVTDSVTPTVTETVTPLYKEEETIEETKEETNSCVSPPPAVKTRSSKPDHSATKEQILQIANEFRASRFGQAPLRSVNSRELNAALKKHSPEECVLIAQWYFGVHTWERKSEYMTLQNCYADSEKKLQKALDAQTTQAPRIIDRPAPNRTRSVFDNLRNQGETNGSETGNRTSHDDTRGDLPSCEDHRRDRPGLALCA